MGNEIKAITSILVTLVLMFVVVISLFVGVLVASRRHQSTPLRRNESQNQHHRERHRERHRNAFHWRRIRLALSGVVERGDAVDCIPLATQIGDAAEVLVDRLLWDYSAAAAPDSLLRTRGGGLATVAAIAARARDPRHTARNARAGPDVLRLIAESLRRRRRQRSAMGNTALSPRDWEGLEGLSAPNTGTELLTCEEVYGEGAVYARNPANSAVRYRIGEEECDAKIEHIFMRASWVPESLSTLLWGTRSDPESRALSKEESPRREEVSQQQMLQIRTSCSSPFETTQV